MPYLDKKHIIIGLLLVLALIFGIGYKAGQMRETAGLEPVIASMADSGTADMAASPAADTDSGAADPGAQREEGAYPSSARTVTVHVAGAVERPGVYSFPEGTRINEAVSQAGPTKEAELTYLNLAEIMTDQQQIIVPRKDQVGQGSPAQAGSSGSVRIGSTAPGNGKVNINTAGAAALEKLPGIGPATAQKIIDYRSQHGPFRDISELMKVSGIGEKKFARLKDKVSI